MGVNITRLGGNYRTLLPAQGADKAYVILLPEATYVSQNGVLIYIEFTVAFKVCK